MELQTKAVDNNNLMYDVYLELSSSQYYPNAPILRIDKTPGQWFMFTLLEDYPQLGGYIFIDYGTRWTCHNINALIAEALQVILRGEFSHEMERVTNRDRSRYRVV